MRDDHPTPEEVLSIRLAAGLTQEESGAVVKPTRNAPGKTGERPRKAQMPAWRLKTFD